MNGYPKATDENKINSQYQKLNSLLKKSIEEDGEPVKDNPRGHKGSSGSYSGPMDSNLMTWTQMLESMDEISDAIESHGNDMMEDKIEDDPEPAEPTEPSDDLVDELNRIFTPVLIMQGFENDSADKIQEAMSEAAVFTERSVIQFDDDARMSQLISVCALLLARKKQTEKYRMYAKAHKIKNQMKIDIQKEEYDDAVNLAKTYLNKVVMTNNSPVARNAAESLLPATQH